MSRRLTSLNWIRVFEAAARTSSFARAAERLAMSPPAVSQQIRALEDHLGRRLFNRAAAGVTLTDDGRALLSACSNSLARIEAITDEFAQPKQKTIVVAASLMFSIGWLAPKLPEFLEAHKDIKIDLRAMNGRPERPDPDVGIWVAFGPYPTGLVANRLFGEVLTPVAMPAIAEKIKTIKDFFDHILIEPTAHEMTWANVLGLPVLPSSARTIKVDNSLAALELAKAGGGIALARAPATDSLIQKSILKPCLEDFSVLGSESYHVLHYDNVRMSKEIELFKNWLLKKAENEVGFKNT